MKKNYKAKFSIISILKNKIDKNNFEKNYNKKKGKEKKSMCSRKKNNVKKYYNNLQYFIRKIIEFFHIC